MNTGGYWHEQLSGLDAPEIITALMRQRTLRMAFASSLGAEDQVLTDMVMKAGLRCVIFVIDTGMLHEETMELIERTERFYGFTYTIYRPQSGAVAQMLHEHGDGLYYRSIELRKKCCHVRKVEPLTRALAGLDLWITGMRREQSVTRSSIDAVEWDVANAIIKVSPLARWSAAEVWGYIRQHRIPYNTLHHRNFPSIGCAPCTRAVSPDEDPRAGRWWWEEPRHRECGLHVQTRNCKEAL